jgi:hypothetical protein
MIFLFEANLNPDRHLNLTIFPIYFEKGVLFTDAAKPHGLGPELVFFK